MHIYRLILLVSVYAYIFPITYEEAGVNIKETDNFVTYIKQLSGQEDIGSFGGAFDIGALNYKHPILVCGADGVGTKLLIAHAVNKHDTLGIDLVAMNVNDLLVHGAQPIGFMDYIASGKFDALVAQDIIKGIVDGCKQAGCVLLGGETAEMPGLYEHGHYDLAGFALGCVEKTEYLPKKEFIKEGDIVIGIASNGVHSNGFSLVRRIIAQQEANLYGKPPFRSSKSMLYDELLKPTKIYVACVLPLMHQGLIKAAAHITGGGLYDNIPRVLPEQLGVTLDMNCWPVPPIFGWLQDKGNVPTDDMLHTFNMGIGFVLIVAPEHADAVLQQLYDADERAYCIGCVTCRTKNEVVHIKHKKHPSYRSTERILIIGSGAREHAIAWKVAQSPHVRNIYVAPGNGGTGDELKVCNVTLPALDNNAVVDFCKQHDIDLVIVGPEEALAHGIVDACTKNGIACLGPSQAAAQLESSKAFAKDFMQRHHIPTAAYTICTTYEEAQQYIAQQTAFPLVIKADGLAAGKGVIIAHTQQEAIDAVERMMIKKAFGTAGDKVVIEQFLSGTELSFIVLTDGQHIIPMATAQDYKTLYPGNCGPNTGGMGAISPSPLITPELQERIMQDIITPAVKGMYYEGQPYTGFLFAGLMITPDGDPYVLEFNCRLGDPETEVILLRLQSDLVQLCNATLDHTLNDVIVKWSEHSATGVMLVSGGYPGHYRKGDVITGLNTDTNCNIFHAGTTKVDDSIVTNGGRVLCICALDDTHAHARNHIDHLIEQIHWPDMFYRADIGY